MTNDTQLTLNMIRHQLRWLEREITLLQEKLALAAPPANPPRSFASLRGIWADVIFDEQDIEASRLKMPEGLCCATFSTLIPCSGIWATTRVSAQMRNES